ncbi:MAG: hypothetical protein IM492_00310 [Microcystis sp. M040S2]|nr:MULTISPECIES: hypothetical protein [unclassified Microcystis]MCA2620025.1 hypothetical protein [Microcystis sp. M099S2]MCA2651882.1 hypothetical protein [Microcystis sp. M065S2]MCA2680122.1 hypothetical protein [Microcystis sp. M043S2]MCA2694747.1 hypothetical protein [Microcystis sp. M040S2]MCA2808073.1 hypothetical protein [Microcystis sp. M095S1]MCA2826582.1 hypothetical protein [Microcystis sp. M088S1]MCA2831861.1 hypothetical protein [Microcystis sp. M086S1]MCA2852117.1 hypothetical
MLFSHSWGGQDDYRNWWRPIFRWFFLILVANVPRVMAEPLDKSTKSLSGERFN